MKSSFQSLILIAILPPLPAPPQEKITRPYNLTICNESSMEPFLQGKLCHGLYAYLGIEKPNKLKPAQ